MDSVGGKECDYLVELPDDPGAAALLLLELLQMRSGGALARSCAYTGYLC